MHQNPGEKHLNVGSCFTRERPRGSSKQTKMESQRISKSNPKLIPNCPGSSKINSLDSGSSYRIPHQKSTTSHPGIWIPHPRTQIQDTGSWLQDPHPEPHTTESTSHHPGGRHERPTLKLTSKVPEMIVQIRSPHGGTPH